MNTISDLLRESQEMKSGLNVRTMGGLVEDMEIVGFVPLPSDEVLGNDFLHVFDQPVVGVSQIRVTRWNGKGERLWEYLPVADCIGTLGECYIDPFVKILNIPNDIKKDFFKYLQAVRPSVSVEQLRKKMLDSGLFLEAGSSLHYVLRPNEFAFYRKKRVVGISDSFVCLCSFISPKSGKLEYMIKGPDDLMPLFPKDK